MQKPVNTWAVSNGRLSVYRNRELVAEFDVAAFPRMMLDMLIHMREVDATRQPRD